MKKRRRGAWQWGKYDADLQWLYASVLDSDFDDFGGDLTLAQIANPQFELYKSRKQNTGQKDPW